ncbi:MAG TPA: hypothetical protein VE685_19210 [Thermoanaerobaculia bacterium]|nr:hypothetical protein [Thermoanaerobaculia bacterium]
MVSLPPSPARRTTTLYSCAERIAAEQAPRAAAVLLGLRWSFGLPSSPLEEMTEYSLPLNPTPLPAALAQRGDLRIARYEGDDEVSLHDYLAAGGTAIVAVDVWHVPFRPAYRRVHTSRTVLVRRDRGDGRLLVLDPWGAPAESTVSPEELERARSSAVPFDAEREPLFSGNPVGRVWFTVEADPFCVDDAEDWVRARLGWLYGEMALFRSDEKGQYGIEALRTFRRWLEARLAGPLDGEESLAARRGASLLLRPELTSRIYLGVFLRNAAHLLGDAGLCGEVERYRLDLGHWQSALDALMKTVRTRRPEYDVFIRDQLARAWDNEERLLRTLSLYALD